MSDIKTIRREHPPGDGVTISYIRELQQHKFNLSHMYVEWFDRHVDDPIPEIRKVKATFRLFYDAIESTLSNIEKNKNMNELIHIREENGKKAVSARELYEKLGLDKSQWKRWYVKNITGNSFAIERTDWEGFDIMSNGNPSMDFALSIDFAKKLCMLARTEAGEKIRNYFIEIEKVATQQIENLEPEELLLRQVQMMIDQKKRLARVESDVNQLKAQTVTRPDYFTIAGYATLKGQKINLNTAARIGTRAAKLCRDQQYEMGECSDPRFGRVRTYPRDVLDHVFGQPIM